MPATRAGTSTSREPAVCAGSSYSIGTVRGCPSCPATTAGGMPPCPPGGPFGPQAAARRAIRISEPARDRRESMMDMGNPRAIYFVLGGGDNLHTNTYVCQIRFVTGRFVTEGAP